MKIKINIDIEHIPGHSTYIKLWRGGLIYIERASEHARPKSLWRAEVEKEAGEYIIFWRSLCVMFAPPGWKPQRANG